MAERFEGMVLKDHPAHKPIDCGCVVLALAQHEADMAHEVACGCDDQPFCALCSGTGRVTLGALVAADRAKRMGEQPTLLVRGRRE